MSELAFHTNLGVAFGATSGLCVWIIIEEYILNLLNINVDNTVKIYLFIASIVMLALSVYVDEKYLKEQKLKGDSN